MAQSHDARRVVGAAGLGDAVCLSANGSQNSPGPFPSQAKNSAEAWRGKGGVS
jgi:hypothetical protein